MKKIFIVAIPVVSILVAITLVSVYYQIESTRPVCIEGSFSNGTCRGAVLIELEPNVTRVDSLRKYIP